MIPALVGGITVIALLVGGLFGAAWHQSDVSIPTSPAIIVNERAPEAGAFVEYRREETNATGDVLGAKSETVVREIIREPYYIVVGAPQIASPSQSTKVGKGLKKKGDTIRCDNASDDSFGCLSANDFENFQGKLDEDALESSEDILDLIGDGTGTGALVFGTAPTIDSLKLSGITSSLLATDASGTVGATSTISLTGLTVTGGATSTFQNGINLATGCFAVGGVCITGGGGGGGIDTLNGLVATTQNFATGTDANIRIAITSSGSTHTFTPSWNGVLSVARGGTGTSSAPSAGQLLLGNASGGYDLVSTSSLGITGGGGGISSLGGQTGASQTFATSSALGGWGFTSSGDIHTLRIPTANASTALGLLSNTDWSIFNSKQSALTAGNNISIDGVTVNSLALATTSIDSLAKIEAIAGVTNILVENDIDASSELSALMDDETGSGALVFAGSPTFTGTALFTNATGTNLELDGRLFDASNSAGSNGMVLQTNGSGVTWVATSSLGFGTGSGTVNSGTTGQIAYYGANGTTVTGTSSIFVASNSNVGIGNASPASILTINTGTPTAATGGWQFGSDDSTRTYREGVGSIRTLANWTFNNNLTVSNLLQASSFLNATNQGVYMSGGAVSLQTQTLQPVPPLSPALQQTPPPHAS
jgi:hypothetical protein